MTQKGWLGPYPPTARHADDVTLADLIDLRKRLAEAEMQRDNALAAVTKLHHENKRLIDWMRHVGHSASVALKDKL
jgi:hypothetical protein